MSYTETLETQGDYRVQLIAEESPDEPYDDGQSPLIRLDSRGGYWQAEHIAKASRPDDDDARIEEATVRWGTDFDKLTRYLRAYYGATQVEWWHSGSYWYITYDTAAWREYIGAPEGSASMAEYRAYIEGDVWGYAIQKRVTWTTKEDFPDRDTWETTESLWGFYGYDWARQAALEDFRQTVDEQGKSD